MIESYRHRFVIQCLSQWLSDARENAIRSSSNAIRLAQFRWTIEGSLSDTIVVQEAPIIVETGMSGEWMDVEEGGKRKAVPTYRDLCILYPEPLSFFIIDVALMRGREFIAAIEIRAKSVVGDDKRAYLKTRSFPTIELSADWVLSKVGTPKFIEVIDRFAYPYSEIEDLLPGFEPSIYDQERSCPMTLAVGQDERENLRARTGRPVVLLSPADLPTSVTTEQCLVTLWRYSGTLIIRFNDDQKGLRLAERITDKALELITDDKHSDGGKRLLRLEPVISAGNWAAVAVPDGLQEWSGAAEAMEIAPQLFRLATRLWQTRLPPPKSRLSPPTLTPRPTDGFLRMVSRFSLETVKSWLCRKLASLINTVPSGDVA